MHGHAASRWRIQLWPQWPAKECHTEHGLHLLDSHAGSISSVMFMQLAHDLRICANRLHQPEGSVAELEDDSRLLLKVLGGHVHRLEHWAKALDNPKLVALAFGDKPSKLRFRYSSELLLHCLVAAFGVRGEDYLQTVKHVLRVALPVQLQPLVGTLANSLPKKSTIKRARYYLDFALTIRQQHLSASWGPARRYWWADASPLTGREWLWLQEQSIADKDLIGALADAHALITDMASLDLDKAHASVKLKQNLMRGTPRNGSGMIFFAEALDSVSPDLLQRHRRLQDVIHNYIYAPAVHEN
eukprot:6488773-Amphidinium_carterae.2